MDTRTVSMETKGVMAQIREHLAQGMSSGEVIAMGYVPSTVWKVQRWVRKKGQGDGRAPVQGTVVASKAAADNEARARIEKLEAENEELRQQMDNLAEQLADADNDRLELYQAKERLEAEAQTLRERVPTLEAEATAASQLRRRVADLEARLRQAEEEQRRLTQAVESSQRQVRAEHSARMEAEATATRLEIHKGQLQRQLQERERECQRLVSQAKDVQVREERRERETCPKCGCPWDRHRQAIDLIYGKKVECPTP